MNEIEATKLRTLFDEMVTMNDQGATEVGTLNVQNTVKLGVTLADKIAEPALTKIDRTTTKLGRFRYTKDWLWVGAEQEQNKPS